MVQAGLPHEAGFALLSARNWVTRCPPAFPPETCPSNCLSDESNR